MKISEAIMFAIQKSGGQVDYYQSAEWIGILVKSGYLESDCEGEGPSIKFLLRLTEKGKVYLHNLGLKE